MELSDFEKKRLFDLSQEVRKRVINNEDEPISFACYRCSCDEGIMVFDSKTREPLIRISSNRNLSSDEIYNELVRKRNKLNRQISTLKKANLKEHSLNETTKHLMECSECASESYNKHREEPFIAN